CLLTTIGSPDKYLLGGDSTIKVPFADAPMSFLGFIVIAPFLLIVLAIYLHVFYGYWLACERERQYINQRLIPPIESIPTLFSFPDAVPRVLTGFVFYWLVPLVLITITFKAWALPAMGRPLTYVTGVVTLILMSLQVRRCPDHHRRWWSLPGYTLLAVIIGLIVHITFNPDSFQRPFNLFRAELPKAWLIRRDMTGAHDALANLEEADLRGAILRRADLWEANLRGAQLQKAQLQDAYLWDADLQSAQLQEAQLQGAELLGTHLWDAQLQGAILREASL